MFKFKKEKDSKNYEIPQMMKDYNEIREVFGEYYDLSDLTFDEIFEFIYKKMNNLKDTLIVTSYLRQIEVPLEVVKIVYKIDDEYVENIIDNEIQPLKVKAYRRLKDELPNIKVAFFPDMPHNLEKYYIEFIDRIEYFSEVRKNQKKIEKEINNNIILPELINNQSLLMLLNYFSVKDSMIIANNLDLLDIDEDIVYSIYNFDENDFKELFDRSELLYLKDDLSKRIETLDNIEMERSFFNYEGLSMEYKDLLSRIDDTKKYISGRSR